MPAPRLPEHVAALASELAGLPGAHADLGHTVAAVSEAIGVDPLQAR
jgi:hypothetical protein